MKRKQINLLFLVTALCLLLTHVNAQTKKIGYSAELGSYLGNDGLPFYLLANQFGAVPNNNHLQLSTAIFSDFQNPKSIFDFAYKTAITGYTKTTNKPIINELFGSVRYKNVRLDLGVKNNTVKWGGLSSSNGDILRSNNSRAFPGINLKTIGYIKLPFAKSWLSFKGNYGEYILNDSRAVTNTHLHHKSIYFKSKLSNSLSLITGLDHYVQWGGISSTYGKLPSGFKDYLRYITGSSGGKNATVGDQINAIGNHIGAYRIQLNHFGDNLNWNFYWSHPFEDRSGREMMNYPDALYGVFIDFKKPEALVSQLLTEVTYTKSASFSKTVDHTDSQGVYHAGSGRDQYFNNGIYKSGWTYFGDIIGSPFFTPKTPDSNGIVNGTQLNLNRFLAFNIGINGSFKTMNYRLLIRHITFYGWFDQEYTIKPQQFSFLLEGILPETYTLPFKITIGAGLDNGNMITPKFGGYIKLTKIGFF